MPLVRAEVLVQLEVYNTTSVVSPASRVISRSTVAMELVWAVQYYLPFMVSCQVHLSLYEQYIVIRASLGKFRQALAGQACTQIVGFSLLYIILYVFKTLKS